MVRSNIRFTDGLKTDYHICGGQLGGCLLALQAWKVLSLNKIVEFQQNLCRHLIDDGLQVID